MTPANANVGPTGAALDLARRIVRPDFDILRAAHAELLVTDLDASRRFYVDLLGLIATEEGDDVLFLRGWEEALHHCLVLRRGEEPAVGHLAFRVGAPHDLEALSEEFSRLDCRSEVVEDEPGQGRGLRVTDPFGFPLEFFFEMDSAARMLQRFDLHRGPPIMRFDHFNLHVPEVEAALAHWQSLGFRCSEFIATEGAEERITGAWLLRKPSVHDLALTAGRGPRLHHLGFWVADAGSVIHACDQLAAAGYAASIERGPGRHGVSNAFFVYLRDPDGHRIELYVGDYYTGDPDLEPKRWSLDDPRARSFWGAPPPDSWYLESSSLMGDDGSLVQTRDPEIHERTSLQG